MVNLCTRIRKARNLARVSQAELARRVGVKRSAVTQWEHPTGTTPSVDHMVQIAQETGVRFEWLATGRGPLGSEVEPSPAVIIDDYARDEHESHALDYLRRLSPGRRRMALEILQILSR
ncbi:MAG TPA: helix-turn-helix transcriptional regulator [Lysobacter sp.]|jgi:transcriptional regulator with XRE-family HTH domain|nr:helix-turn-helix transcriptional regulator [Lysobacter sp.]